MQGEYGIRLLPGSGGRTEPERTPFEVADLVVNLPPGSALWRAAGGELAITNEAMLVRELIFRTEMIAWQETGAKGTAPRRIALPSPAGVVQQESAQKASAWERRQAARAARNGGG